MKLPEMFMKTVTGVGIVTLGGLVSLVPVIGSIIYPYICGAGAGMIVWGGGDKIVKKVKYGIDPWKKEKTVINKLTSKKE